MDRTITCITVLRGGARSQRELPKSWFNGRQTFFFPFLFKSAFPTSVSKRIPSGAGSASAPWMDGGVAVFGWIYVRVANGLLVGYGVSVVS